MFTELTDSFLENAIKIARLNNKTGVLEFIKGEDCDTKVLSSHVDEIIKSGIVNEQHIPGLLSFLNSPKNNKRSKYIYTRKIDGKYVPVALEIIPSKDTDIDFFVVRYADENSYKRISDIIKINKTITKNFLSVLYGDIENDTFTLLNAVPEIKEMTKGYTSLKEVFDVITRKIMSKEDYQMVMDYVDVDTLDERINDKDLVNNEFSSPLFGKFRSSILPVNVENGKIKTALFSLQLLSKEINTLRERLSIEKTINECMRIFSGSNDVDGCINQFLDTYRNYFDADSTYIYEYKGQGLYNTYNSTKPGFKTTYYSEVQNTEGLRNAFEKFDKGIVRMNTNDLNKESRVYDIFVKLGVNNIISSPIIENDKVIGFLGILNPRKNTDSDLFINTIGTFIKQEIDKRNYLRNLYLLSYMDKLTETKNRTAYIEQLDKLNEQRFNSLGVVYVDVNSLKFTNDTFGHKTGDSLIVRGAELLKRYFSDYKDYIYRTGGDEFIVLCIDIDKKKFEGIIKDLEQELSCNWIISLGSSYSEQVKNPEIVTKRAEDKMYRVKREYYIDHPELSRRL